MTNWFECKVKYYKVFENGVEKKVSELYLVDAETCTEAEARIIQEFSFCSGVEVKDIRTAPYADVILENDEEKFYKMKLSSTILDEKSGIEKNINSFVLVQANDLREAIDNLDDAMKAFDYKILSVQETSIVNVILYEDGKC